LIDLGIELTPPFQRRKYRKSRSTVPADVKPVVQALQDYTARIYAVLDSDFGMTYWPRKKNLMLHPRTIAVRELVGIDSGEAFDQIIELLQMQLSNRARERKRLRRKIARPSS
jgi:hypothetical protein